LSRCRTSACRFHKAVNVGQKNVDQGHDMEGWPAGCHACLSNASDLQLCPVLCASAFAAECLASTALASRQLPTAAPAAAMQVTLGNGSFTKAFSNAQSAQLRRRCVAVRAEAVAIPSGFKKVSVCR
jgi:hypothetical protein